jgi:hypothetical protein
VTTVGICVTAATALHIRLQTEGIPAVAVDHLRLRTEEHTGSSSGKERKRQ